MRLLLLTILLVLIALASTPVPLVYLAVQSEPLVAPEPSALQEDVGRIKALLQQHDPRDLRDGETRTLTVSERDLNLAVRSVIPMPQRQGSLVSLGQGLGKLDYSLRLPTNPLGEYLNVSLLVSEYDGELAVDSVYLGSTRLPGYMLMPLVVFADSYLKSQFEEYRGAREALQAVYLGPEEASFSYRWDKALAKQIEQRGRQAFLPAADRERALAYYHVLASTSHSVGGRASLDRLLQPMFAEAGRRTAGNGEAAAENRALLLVLGTVLNRSSVHRLVGGNAADLLPGHRYVKWTLHGRGDLAQHFSISAAIASAGGGGLADTIGVFKELDDSRGGSGFSFADLLADRAGVELAGAATSKDGQGIQRAMAAGSLLESDFMPPIDHLPEGLMEMQFKQRYRNLDDARYARVKNEIDTRIARLPIFN